MPIAYAAASDFRPPPRIMHPQVASNDVLVEVSMPKLNGVAGTLRVRYSTARTALAANPPPSFPPASPSIRPSVPHPPRIR